MALTDMIPGVAQVKMIAAGAMLVALLGAGIYVWHLHSEVGSLNKEVIALQTNNKILQTNVDVVKTNLQTCQEADAGNNKTITDLLNERSDAQQAVATLATRSVADKKALGALQQQLTALMKDSANDGPVAKVLKETIRSIQNLRSQ